MTSVYTSGIMYIQKESEVNKMETRKNEAKRNYIEARNNYMENRTNENWIAFCNAKILCRRLGVLI